jgi:hypothetical protein
MRGFLPQSPQISVRDTELSKMEIVPSLMYEIYRLTRALRMLCCSKYLRKKQELFLIKQYFLVMKLVL